MNDASADLRAPRLHAASLVLWYGLCHGLAIIGGLILGLAWNAPWATLVGLVCGALLGLGLMEFVVAPYLFKREFGYVPRRTR